MQKEQKQTYHGGTGEQKTELGSVPDGLKIRTLLPPGNRTRIRGCGTRRETICATRKTVTRARGEPPEGNYRSIHHQTFHLEVAEAVHSGSFLEFGEDLIDRFQSLRAYLPNDLFGAVTYISRSCCDFL